MCAHVFFRSHAIPCHTITTGGFFLINLPSVSGKAFTFYSLHAIIINFEPFFITIYAKVFCAYLGEGKCSIRHIAYSTYTWCSVLMASGQCQQKSHTNTHKLDFWIEFIFMAKRLHRWKCLDIWGKTIISPAYSCLFCCLNPAMFSLYNCIGLMLAPYCCTHLCRFCKVNSFIQHCKFNIWSGILIIIFIVW